MAAISQVGNKSKKLERFLKSAGLPSRRDVGDLLDAGFAAEVQRRVDLMTQYAAATEMVYRNMTAVGWRAANAMHLVVDLQGKLWQLEQALAAEGKNPLESPEWLKARELLSKEVQFIQRLGLDAAKFEADKNRPVTGGGDDLFTVS